MSDPVITITLNGYGLLGLVLLLAGCVGFAIASWLGEREETRRVRRLLDEAERLRR